MEFYDNNMFSVNESRQLTAYTELIKKVYAWMALALCVTGLTAYYVAGNATLISAIVTNKILFFGLMIGELALVFGLTAAINKLSFSKAMLMFILYSVLNGLTMSVIFLAYTMSSIATTFFVTAGTFGVMAAIGYTTKKDMSRFSGFFMMAIIGLVIATVVNIFVASSTLDWIITYAGVFIFIGLTAYDSQRIKNMLMEYGNDVNEGTRKLALMGSLMLYLDFINLFIYLLRIFGKRD